MRVPRRGAFSCWLAAMDFSFLSIRSCSVLSGATSDNPVYVNQTGVIRAPAWKDGFANARDERRLLAVACTRWFGAAPGRKIGAAPFAPALLDHLIGQEQEPWGERQAEGLGGLQVNDQLILHGYFHGQLGGLGAFEKTIDERGHPPPAFGRA